MSTGNNDKAKFLEYVKLNDISFENVDISEKTKNVLHTNNKNLISDIVLVSNEEICKFRGIDKESAIEIVKCKNDYLREHKTAIVEYATRTVEAEKECETTKETNIDNEVEQYLEKLGAHIIEANDDLSGVLYPIGEEPENLKKRLDTLLKKIDEAYPFKIVYGLAKDHKKWAETLTDLYRKLGYPSGSALLRAYGFTIAEKFRNVKTNNYKQFVELLKQKYPNGSQFSKLSELEKDCADLEIKWKSFKNNSETEFGMGLSKYLYSIGILKAEKSSVENEKKFMQLLDDLREKYKEQEKPSTFKELEEQNPAIESMGTFLEFIEKRFRTAPSKFLKEQGIIRGKKETENKKQPMINSADFDISPRGILNQYKGTDTTVVIPEGVKKISTKAFRDCWNTLETLNIPDSVEKIERRAFARLSHLKTVKLSQNLKMIPEGLFEGCHKLCGIEISDNVEVIENNAFSGCSSLQSVKLPRNLKVISSCLFSGCTNLCEIDIPDAVEVIENYSFNECRSLKNVWIPASVKKINPTAWQKTSSIEIFEVDAKNEVYMSLDGVIYNKQQTELVAYPCGRCVSEYRVPNGVVSIGNAAVAFNCKLQKVILPFGLEYIGRSAFYQSVLLEEVEIPDSVKEIEYACFSECENLKIIDIPEGVSCDTSVFRGCKSLEEAGFIIKNNIMYSCNLKGARKICVPDGVKVVAKSAFNCHPQKIYFPDSIEYVYNIPTSATYVSIPCTMKNIGELKDLYSNYSQLNFTIRPDKNDVEYKKYYILPELENLNAKGVLLDFNDDELKAEARAILKRFNASVKRVMSKNVDFVITEDVFSYDKKETHTQTIETCVSTIEKTGIPMLILLDEFLNANEEYVTQKFVSMSSEDKLTYALSLYDTCIGKVKTMMENVGDYTEPICSGDVQIKENLYNTVVSEAFDFLDEIEKREKENSDNYDSCKNKDNSKCSLDSDNDSIYDEDDSWFGLEDTYSIDDDWVDDEFYDDWADDEFDDDLNIGSSGLTPDDNNDFCDCALEEKSDGSSEEIVRSKYRRAYEAIYSESGCNLGCGVGIELPIAIAVACFVYGTPYCEIQLEWVRDKWESRGDYSSHFNVGFKLSKEFADGRVFKCGKEYWDM